MYHKYRKNLKYIISMLIFWILVFLLFSPLDNERNYRLVEGETQNTDGNIGPILSGEYVSQHFIALHDNLESVAIYVATYGDILSDAQYSICIQDSEENEIAKQKVSANELHDNEFYSITFERQEHSGGKEYSISVESINGKAGDCITLWGYSTQKTNETNATKNGSMQDLSLILKTEYYKDYSVLRCTIWGLLILVSFVLTFTIREANEKEFLRIAAVLGILLIIINPFPHALDESTHFFKAYSISNFDFIQDRTSDGYGAMMPQNFDAAISSVLNLRTFFDHIPKWLESFSPTEEFYVNPYAAAYVPINYLVTSIGILIGKLLKLNILGIILLGRLANYSFYVLVCYYAIKNVQYYKTLFFYVATLPTSLWLASSYSTDPILISLSLLFVSICLKYRFTDKQVMISRKDILLIFLCGTTILSSKYFTYAPILLLFFAIPSRFFRPRQKTLCILGAAIFAVVLGGCQIWLLTAFPRNQWSWNKGDNFGGQLTYMLTNWQNTIRTFVDYIVNTNIRHLENLHFEAAILEIGKACGLFMPIIAILEKNKYKQSKQKDKQFVVLSTLAVILCYLLIIGALYVGFTSVGNTTIEGIQTRYIIPFLILVMLLLSKVPLENHICDHERNVSFIMLLGLVNTLAGLVLTYL